MRLSEITGAAYTPKGQRLSEVTGGPNLASKSLSEIDLTNRDGQIDPSMLQHVQDTMRYAPEESTRDIRIPVGTRPKRTAAELMTAGGSLGAGAGMDLKDVNLTPTGKKTFGETVKETDILDVVSHIPGSTLVGLNDIRKKLYEGAKRRLASGDYGSTRQYGMTPMGGYMTTKAPVTKQQLEGSIRGYEKDLDRGETIPAAILGGVADLPGYMAEMTAGGVGKVTSVPKAFVFAAKILPIQWGRLESSITDQVNRGEKGWSAAVKGIGDTYIENLSETAGVGVSKVLSKLPFYGKIVDAGHKYATKTLGWSDTRFWKETATKVGWNGFLGEWGEEDIGTALRSIFKVQDFGADANANISERLFAGLAHDYTAQNMATRAGILAAPGTTMAVAEHITQGRRETRTEAAPEFISQPEGVTPVEANDQVAPEQVEMAMEAEKQAWDAQYGGRNVANLEEQMRRLVDRTEGEKDNGKLKELADQMEALDNEIERIAEVNVRGKSISDLHRLARRQGINVPKGTKRSSIVALLQGNQDVVRTKDGYIARSLVTKGPAGSAWQTEAFPTYEEAQGSLLRQRAENSLATPDETQAAQADEIEDQEIGPVEGRELGDVAGGEQISAARQEPAKVRSDRALLYLGHDLPAKLGIDEESRKALMVKVTGRDSMKKMSPAEKELFVSKLEEQADTAGIEYEYKTTPKDEVIEQLRTRKRTKLTEGERRRATKFKRALNWVAKKWTAYNLNLDLTLKMTEMLDGYADAGPLKTRIYHPIKNAVVAARDRASRTITSMYGGWKERGIDYAKMATNTRDDVVPSFPLTDLERVNIYMLAQNEKGRRRAEAWFEDEAIDNAGAVDRVIESVKSNPQELEIADTIFSYLKTREPAFFTAAERMGIKDVKREENYLMLFTEDMDEVDLPPVVNELMRDFPQSAKTPGERATKERTGTQARAKINLAATLPEMIRNIERFIEVGPVAKDVSKIVDSPTAKDLLNGATRGQGYKILRNWLNQSVRGQLDPERGPLARTAKRLRRNSVVYLLGHKIASVVPKQGLSAFNVMAKHPALAPAIMGRMIKYGDMGVLGNLKKDYELAASKSKMMRNYNWHRDLSRLYGTKDAIRAFKGKRLSPLSMAATAYIDKATRTAVWLSAYDKAIIDLGSDEKAAIQFADDTVTESQPMGDIEDLAPFFRGGVLEKLLTTFMNQPQKNWSFLRHDIYGMLKGGKITPMQATQRFIVGQIMPAILLGIFSRGRLPDGPEEVIEDIAFYMLSPHVFLGRWIFNEATGQWGPEGATGVSIPLTGFTEVGKTIRSAKRGEVQGAVEHGVKAYGAFTGKVPQQVVTTTGGVIDLLQGETDDYKRLIYSEGGIKYREPKNDDSSDRRTRRTGRGGTGR